MCQKLAWLAFAGAIGTLSRFGLAGLIQRLCGERFPWGTLAVNCLGCFVFGLVWSLAEERLLISGETRFIMLTGFMGAFTTFSTFAFETSEQLRDSEWLFAAGNLAAHNLVGIALLSMGISVGRWL